MDDKKYQLPPMPTIRYNKCMKKTSYTLFFILMALCFGGTTQNAHAYFTTGQTQTRLDDNSVLFTIEYAFGYTDKDTYMPVTAVRNLPWKSNEKKIGYKLVDHTGSTTAIGSAKGIVLSNLPIVDLMYKLERGKAHKMTLVVVLVVPQDTARNRYKLQVDKLPFYVGTDVSKLATYQLNPSELQYYVTKPVELNSKPKTPKIQIDVK